MSTRFAAHFEWRSAKLSSSASELKSGGSIECFSSLCEMKKRSARFWSTSGGDRAVLLRAYRRAHCDEEVRILWEYALLGRQLQCLGEAFAQLGEEIERTAEECDSALYPAPAGEAAYRLVYYGLEYRGRDVRLRRSVVEQRLNVVFAKTPQREATG